MKGTPLFEWYLWGETAAKNGFVGITSKAGYPDVYSNAGDAVDLRKLKNPFLMGGFTLGLTKTGGGRVQGNLSYGKEYNYFPGVMDARPIQSCFNRVPQVYQKEEVITGQADSANVNEATMMAALFSYGVPHRYPQTIQEMVSLFGIKIKEIRTPQFSVTTAAALTSGSGAVKMEDASQEDLWIEKESEYYILGAIPHLVNNPGMLQFTTNLPKLDYHANVLPLTRGADPVSFGGGEICLPYEPIGPFGMSSQPKIGMFGLDATATTFSLIIARL